MKTGRRGEPWPLVICAAAAGYYIGKYQGFLRGRSEYHQLKALPSSDLGKVLNQRKNFNPDEKQFFQDWIKETFKSRCLPISSVMGTLTLVSVQSGTMHLVLFVIHFYKILIQL